MTKLLISPCTFQVNILLFFSCWVLFVLFFCLQMEDESERVFYRSMYGSSTTGWIFRMCVYATVHDLFTNLFSLSWVSTLWNFLLRVHNCIKKKSKLDQYICSQTVGEGNKCKKYNVKHFVRYMLCIGFKN